MYKYENIDDTKFSNFALNEKSDPHKAGRTAETVITALLIIAAMLAGFIADGMLAGLL